MIKSRRKRQAARTERSVNRDLEHMSYAQTPPNPPTARLLTSFPIRYPLLLQHVIISSMCAKDVWVVMLIPPASTRRAVPVRTIWPPEFHLGPSESAIYTHLYMETSSRYEPGKLSDMTVSGITSSVARHLLPHLPVQERRYGGLVRITASAHDPARAILDQISARNGIVFLYDPSFSLYAINTIDGETSIARADITSPSYVPETGCLESFLRIAPWILTSADIYVRSYNSVISTSEARYQFFISSLC
ncbi:hypothetical protein DL93DRAFT_2234375 [Clavulina sp. PMI_390]|nr:hypothetical protein DL93DRAFT_2234375 [Clavulina sp. PMI_390]